MVKSYNLTLKKYQSHNQNFEVNNKPLLVIIEFGRLWGKTTTFIITSTSFGASMAIFTSCNIPFLLVSQ